MYCILFVILLRVTQPNDVLHFVFTKWSRGRGGVVFCGPRGTYFVPREHDGRLLHGKDTQQVLETLRYRPQSYSKRSAFPAGLPTQFETNVLN